MTVPYVFLWTNSARIRNRHLNRWPDLAIWVVFLYKFLPLSRRKQCLPGDGILKCRGIEVEAEQISDQRQVGGSWTGWHPSKLVEVDQLVYYKRQQ